MNRRLGQLAVLASCIGCSAQEAGTGTSSPTRDPIGSEGTTLVSIESSGNPVEGPTLCTGTLPATARLDEVSLTPAALQDGVDCVAGDFDGNGETDYLLYGAIDRRPQTDPRPTACLVVFVEDGAILEQSIVRYRRLVRPLLYSPRETPGRFGEPASSLPGFIEPGEGGTTVVGLFDPVTRQWRLSRHASESR